MNMEKKRFKGNLIIALVSQVISTSAGIAISFILPKFLGIEQYAYWQLFLFYVAYVNVLAFGLFEGIYLKHGGKEYENLDTSLLGTEWKIYIAIQGLFSIIMMLIIFISKINVDRKFVLGCCCICIVVINSNDYLGRILQAVNCTKIYSISVIIYNILWFIAIGIVYFGKIYSYKIIVIMYVLGHIFAGIYLINKSRKIVFSSKCKIKYVIYDMKDNIKIGINLFVAGYASSLIIGSARFLVDSFWGIEIFGKVSFTLSITYFFLRFINQVSMTMFPALRRVETGKMKIIFSTVSSGLDIFLPGILLGYVPMKLLLGIWLPHYSESLEYLALLLPICVFDGKMQLLFDTYYKVLRKERKLLLLNVSTMFFSIAITLFLLCVYHNLLLVLLGIVFVIAIRSFRAYNYLSKIFDTPFEDYILTFILVLIFILSSWFLSDIFSFLLYLVFYLVYIIYNWEKTKMVINVMLKFLKT